MSGAHEAEFCVHCGEELRSVLVFLRGAMRRRVRQIQCPNHCECLCPVCGRELRVTNQKYVSVNPTKPKKFKCNWCEWTGQNPDLNLLEVKRALEHEALLLAKAEEDRIALETNRAFWRSQEPVSGSPCHECGTSLQWFERRTVANSHGEYLVQRKLSCNGRNCYRTFKVETVIRYESLARQSKWRDYESLDRSWEP